MRHKTSYIYLLHLVLGEDGGEASSAGQMETYLGVCGVDKVLEAVRKCWASAYTYQAVEYRRYCY